MRSKIEVALALEQAERSLQEHYYSGRAAMASNADITSAKKTRIETLKWVLNDR